MTVDPGVPGRVDVDQGLVELTAADLAAAGRVLAGEGLVGPFGQVSVRLTPQTFLITAPVPLDRPVAAELAVVVDVRAAALPPGVPAEAHLHAAVYQGRPDVQAVCRAEPQAAQAVAASSRPLRPLHGHGVLASTFVPVLDDARLVRTRDRALAAAERLGDATALLLRGSGAVTVGRSLGAAVARMWALEASAQLNLPLLGLDGVRELDPDEIDHWSGMADELLGRIWAHLRARHA
jgi:HCOMODA/2-hydroxy-3-carboxy-muconic semialdehyde decarboxylase